LRYALAEALCKSNSSANICNKKSMMVWSIVDKLVLAKKLPALSL
jgi:hypothetical protein